MPDREPCAPSWSTKRNLDRPTFGPAAVAMSRVLGWEPMRHQVETYDVGLEYDPDTGKLIYSMIVFTGPRQIGKTSVNLPWAVLRCNTFGDDQNVIYTAQDRNHAYRKFVKDHVKAIRRSDFREGVDYKVRLANGSEGIEWLKTGSSHKVSAVQSTSGHGEVLDLACIDEAFAHKNEDVDASFRPAMAARTNLAGHFGPQSLVTSTKGDQFSAYLNRKIKVGRKAVEDGVQDGICYIEYSAPDDCDIYDEANWWLANPALGRTISLEFMRSEARSMRPEEFARAYLNIAKKESTGEGAITYDVWSSAMNRRSDIGGHVCLAIDRPPNGERTVIAAAGWSAVEHKAHVEIVDNRPGSDWVVPRLRELHGQHDVVSVSLDPRSNAGAFLPAMMAEDFNIVSYPVGKMVQACGAFFDALNDGAVAHIGQSDLDSAALNAARSVEGEGWRWLPRQRGEFISPLVASTMAFASLQSYAPDDEGDEDSVYTDRGFLDLSDYM